MKKLAFLVALVLVGVSAFVPAGAAPPPTGTEGAKPDAKTAAPKPEVKGRKAKPPSKTRKHKAII